MKFLNKFFLITFLGFVFSCSNNLDFDQVQEIETAPVFNISLGFFNITSNGFAGAGSAPLPSVNEDIEYRIFENQLLRDNLVRLEYNINITNTFNRSFTFSFRFLDENGDTTFLSDSYIIDANSASFEEILIHDKELLNNNIKETTRLRLELSLEDKSVPLSAGSAGTFSFKSSTIVYLETSINNEE
jgi:hypothetical protein